MITISKKTLEKNLESIAQYYCAYKSKSGQLCDCKYLPYECTVGDLNFCHESYCGCPEIKLALTIIKTMKKKEWKKILTRYKKQQRQLEKLSQQLDVEE